MVRRRTHEVPSTPDLSLGTREVTVEDGGVGPIGANTEVRGCGPTTHRGVTRVVVRPSESKGQTSRS